MYFIRKKKQYKNDKETDKETNKETNKETDKETDITHCLICWEPENNNNKLTKMKNIMMFTSYCKCDCYFHLQCFFDWVKKSPTCPICRDTLTINNELFEIYNIGSQKNYKIKIFFRIIVSLSYKILKMIINYTTMLFLLYVSINIIRHIINQYRFNLIE